MIDSLFVRVDTTQAYPVAQWVLPNATHHATSGWNTLLMSCFAICVVMVTLVGVVASFKLLMKMLTEW